jgi:hypothetical protein
LFDLGDDAGLPFLERALGDDAFEVRLEAQAAIGRIRGGAEGAEPMWRRISKKT